MSSDGRGGLSKAVEKAASEVTSAGSAISKGCEPAEALETKIKNGPQDVINEFNDLSERSKNNSNYKPEAVILQIDKDGPLMRFRLSTCGKFLIPLAHEIIPHLSKENGPQDLGASDKDERKRRENVAKSEGNFLKAFKAGKHVQSALKLPASTAPIIGRVFTPNGVDWLPMIGSILTASVIGYMKLAYKNQK